MTTPRTIDAGYAEGNVLCGECGSPLDDGHCTKCSGGLPKGWLATEMTDLEAQLTEARAKKEMMMASWTECQQRLGEAQADVKRLASQLGRYSFKDRAEAAERERDHYKALAKGLEKAVRIALKSILRFPSSVHDEAMLALERALPAPSLPEEPINKEPSP